MANAVASETKSSRPGMFRRMGNFFRDAWGELKRVRWPNRKELVSYTVVVLVTCIIIILLLFAYDLGISYLLKLIGLGK